MKKTLHIFAIIALLVSISGCGVHIEKRKFRKGLHISWNKKQRSSKEKIAEQPFSSSPQQKNTNEQVAHSSSPVQNKMEVKKETLSQNTSPKKHSSIKYTIRGNKEKKEVSSVKIASSINLKKADKNERSNHSGYLYLLAALGIPFAAFNKKRNYKLSSWAVDNQKKARWIIGASTATAFLSSYFVGRLWHFDTPELSLPIAMAMAGTGGATYLLSKSNRGRVTGGMMLNIAANFGAFTLGTIRPTLEAENPYIMQTGLIILFTFLLILAFIVSGYLIAALSCTIACNGYGFASVAVLIGGMYLASFLLMLGMLNIYRKKGDEERSFAKTAALTALIVVAVLALFVLVLALI